ncbi:MAG: hypothetical protein M3400_01065 [Actinomycetota bacterium]|nr:hypothetical protein [Actinomycetota bacterium]
MRLRAAREVLERVVPRHGSLSVTVATGRDAQEAAGKSPTEIIDGKVVPMAESLLDFLGSDITPDQSTPWL